MNFPNPKHYIVINNIRIDLSGFPNQYETLGFQIEKLASYPTPADNYIYLYRITDLRDYGEDYVIVNNIPYWDEDGNKDSIEYETMKSMNSVEAFREFISEAEQHAF